MNRLKIFFSLSILLVCGIAQAQETPKLSLQQAIATALENLPDVQAARGKLQAAEAKADFAQSLYYPDIHLLAEGLQGTNNQTRSSYLALPGIPRTGVEGMDWKTSSNFLGGLVINQVLYDFGRRAGALSTGEARSQAAGSGLVATQQEAVFSTKQAYFAVLAAQRLITVDQAAVNRRQKILEMAQKGYEIGLRPKIDVSTAKTNLSDAQIALIRAGGELKNAKAALDHAMGMENPVSYEVEDILDYREVPGSLEAFLNKAYKNRPDLKEMLHEEEASKKEVETVKSDYFPFVTASASVNARGSDFPMTSNWDVAVILDVPINWFRVSHQVSEARAHLEEENAQVRSARQRVALEVEVAYNDLISTKESIPAVRQSLDEAKERLEIAEGRYKVGVGNIIELTDAQTFLTNADSGYVRALYDYNEATARLERAIGETLTGEK